MFDARIGLRPLSQLCHRVGSSLKSGVEARKVWQRESERGSSSYRQRIELISQAVNRGETLSDALGEANGYFPPLLREMASVGEKTGKLDDVLLRLASHYEHLLTLRRAFGVAIIWPALQLTLAVFIIGGAIGIMGWIGGDEADIFGFGLVGTKGMLIYFSAVAIVSASGFFLVRALLRGTLSSALMTPLMEIPIVGPSLRQMAMARLTWSLALAMDAGMDAKNSVRVALESTRNKYFTRHTKSVTASIARSQEIHEALRDTGAFPEDFLDTVEAGETSGRLPESMTVLSKQYEDRARAASSAMTVVVAIGIWGCVAAMLIFMIFRVFMFYTGMIESFAQ